MRRLTCGLVLALVGCGDGVLLNIEGESDLGVQADASSSLDAGMDVGRDVAVWEDDVAVADVAPRDADPSDVGGANEAGPPRYGNEVVSGVDTRVVAALQAIASKADRQENVFAKIGDSNTVNTNYLACFAGNNVDLGGLGLDETWRFFRDGQAGTTTPYNRVSSAAVVGWSASAALAGSPSPLSNEVNAISPRYATVQFGTNDIQAMNISRYAENMMDIADQLIELGVIPIVTAIPARGDSATADTWVPRYNAVARGVAQTRRVPWVDVHQIYETLPARGLISDGLHLNAYNSGGAKACVLTSAGLQFGMNVRNRWVLEALDKTRRGLAGVAPDTLASIPGVGTLEDPIEIEAFPFADRRDTTAAAQRRYDDYPGCDATQNESGGEFVYRVVIETAGTYRFMVFDRADTDIDIHLLDATGQPAGCIDRAHEIIVAQLSPGTYHIVLDSFVAASGAERSGDYLFVAVRE